MGKAAVPMKPTPYGTASAEQSDGATARANGASPAKNEFANFSTNKNNAADRVSLILYIVIFASSYALVAAATAAASASVAVVIISAAYEGEKQQCYDDKPNYFVVKKVAKAVHIYYGSEEPSFRLFVRGVCRESIAL